MRQIHHRHEIVLLIAALGLLLASLSGPQVLEAAPSADAAVQKAWRRAQEVGVYHFTTEIAQTTYPAPALRNAGQSAKTEQLYLEGRVNTPEREMELRLRPEGGHALSFRDSFEVRIDGDETYGRLPGGTWRELDDFSEGFAPTGDLLAYLAGARNVRSAADEEADEAGHYVYEIDGPSFADYVRDQLQQHLMEEGQLPPGLRLESSAIYRDVEGDGEVWVNGDGLPARLAVDLVYPPAANGERVKAEIKTDFFGFPEKAQGRLPDLIHDRLPRTAGERRELTRRLGLVIGTVSFLGVLVFRRSSRTLYTAVVLALLFSMVVVPLLNDIKAAAFIEDQREKRYQQQEDQAERENASRVKAQLEGPNWDPQRDPLAPRGGPPAAELGAESEQLSLSTESETSSSLDASLCTHDEKETDSDEDGLTDCEEKTIHLTDPEEEDSDGDGLLDGWEILRLGTVANADLGVDSDGDGIGDGLEVAGFSYRGQAWYSDPSGADSDGDGRPDGLECPQRFNVDTEGAEVEGPDDPDVPCVDTDDDGVPDLFDHDSDEDGVPDSLDLSPLTVLGQETPFGRSEPFQLLVNNLQQRPNSEGGYFPTLVDLQLRPENPEHLTYALNVLDWPSGDQMGQIQRQQGNDSTFADAMPSEEGGDPRSANGDLRLIPMLEIEMTGAHLPLPTTTAQTTLNWENTFDLELTLTQQEGGIEARLSEAPDGDQAYGFQIYEGVCGNLGEAVGARFALSNNSARSVRDDLGQLVNVADGEHVVMADEGQRPDAVQACVRLNDLPNGNSSTQMIDSEPLKAYGMSVRDKDNEGSVLVYTPLNVLPDETGGGRTAFSARVFYQPQTGNLGQVAQQVRVVWLVQALTDWCKPAPADLSEEEVESWCDSAGNWSLDNPQVVHSYYEEWYLTGLSVREDRGLNVAVAWEDPAGESEAERQHENWLWGLGRGLDAAYVSGRDQNEDGVRDVGVATENGGLTLAESTIDERFGPSREPSVTEVDRFGIPLTATFGVETFAYPNQDHLAHIMMTESQRILEDNFGDYPEATPTLLFAREEVYRSASLDGTASTGEAATVDFAERDVQVWAALSWAPYRFQQGDGIDSGAWQAYPMADYWERLGTQLEDLFHSDPDLPEGLREDVLYGEIALAQAYYLMLNQGQVNQVQTNDLPLGGVGPSDSSLAEGIATTLSAFLVQMLAEELAVAIWPDTASNGSSESGGGADTDRTSRLARLGGASQADVSGQSRLQQQLKRIRTRLAASKRSLGRTIGIVAAIGVLSVLAVTLVATGVISANMAQVIEVAVQSMVASTSVYTMVTTFSSAMKAWRTAQRAGALAGTAVNKIATVVSQQLQKVKTATKACALVGLILGTAVAFATMLTTLIVGRHRLRSLAAHATAEAVAYIAVAVIMFAISLIPVVGQIIAAVIAAIDALIAAACAVGSAVAGDDVSRRPGGWICKGISGLAAELIKQVIYGTTVLVDLGDEDRLAFGAMHYALPDPERGLSAGNEVRYSTELTNTIELVSVTPATDEMIEGWKDGTQFFPADWKSMSYAWQFKDENAKKAVFDYRWQTEEEDLEGLVFESMSDEWEPTEEEHSFRINADPTSAPIPLGPAGLNQRPALFLSEGYVLPVQECFAFPSGPQCALAPYVPYTCLVPVCYINEKRGTSHLDLGDRFIVDIFPRTLDGFYEPTTKRGGYTPAWAQASTTAEGGTSRFPVQADFDGDGLLAQVKGGSDPDDSQWDTDGDGVNDAVEYEQGTDPTMYDTDRDGLNDAEELQAGTDPRREDSDGDGLTDGEELAGWEIVYAFGAAGEQLRTRVSSDPLLVDGDDDALTDFKEKVYGFSPECASDPNVLKMASAAREGDAPRLLLRFDEAAGSESFADASGYGKMATCAGRTSCPTATDGRYVYGLHFEEGDALRVRHSELNALRNDLTLAAWVRPETVVGWQTLIGTSYSESFNGYRLRLAGSSIDLQTAGVATYRQNGVNLEPGEWTHIAVVMGVDNAVTFYVNGVAIGTDDGQYPARPDTDDDLLIGASAYPDGGLYDTFRGDLDEVAVFDRALAAGEVATLAEARYNPNDLIVQPGATMAYTSTLTNKLYDRYAQGLHSVEALQGGLLTQTPPPQTFVLQPLGESTLAGEVHVADTVASGAFTLTQQAEAQIMDWRETSNYAAMWLPLNEPAGATAFADDSGNLPPRDATCSGAGCPTAQAPGYFDHALSFGGDDYLTLESTRRLGLHDGDFTVSAWIKGSDFPTSGSTANDRAIMGTDGGLGSALQLIVRHGQPTMSFGGQTLSADVTLETDVWYHVVFRYDSYEGKQSIAVNGDVQGTQSGVAPFTGEGTAYLGRARGDCFEEGVCFQGTIDDVRTFGRALSLEEIRALYNRPVLRLPFEENASATQRAPDGSGFGNDARCVGLDCPGSASGVYGEQAASFAGDDHLDVAGASSLDLGEGQFTIATWVWPDEASSNSDHPQGILGRYRGAGDTAVEGPGEAFDGVEHSYPSLFNVGGRLRFGYGTGAEWVTRTTSDTVLTDESWNHVVLSFGPQYATDGTFEQYRAVLYVNNEVRADWGMGEAGPAAAESGFFIGRASDQAAFSIHRFDVIEEADGVGSCEIELHREDQRIGRWEDLGDGDVVEVNETYLFTDQDMLRAWETDRGDDDPLCELAAQSCEGRGHRYSTDAPSYERKTLEWRGDDSDIGDKDTTHIKIFLGDSGNPAFFNPSIPFRGRMDELTMYKRPLSAREVQELYFSASMAMRLPLDDAPGSETFQDTVDVRLEGGAYCSASTCPTAGINGRENQAALFDGQDDVLQTDIHLDPSPSGGGATLTAWARPSSVSGFDNVIRSQGHGWSIVRAGDAWRIYDGQGAAAVSAPVDVGKWQHLAAVFDPEAGLTLYKNGAAVNDTPQEIHTNDEPLPIRVGGSFDGALDDVRVFNRPLAAGDVETLYERAPVLQLHLDETRGDAPPFQDVAGGLEANCEAGRCPKAGLSGQVGLAVSFNLEAGTQTAPLNVGHTPDLDTERFTIGAWVLPTTMKGTRQILVQNGANASLYIPADSLHATVAFGHDGGEASLSSVTPLVMNVWNHVVGTYDGGTLRIYVNGYLQGEIAISATPSTADDPLQVGSQAFAGRLDEITLYSRALAATEVSDIFHYQGKLVQARSGTWITVDDEPPVSVLRSYNADQPYITPDGVSLHVEAHDETSRVSMVELGVDSGPGTSAYTAVPRCTDAADVPTGATAWCPYFKPPGEGTYELTTRATDQAGHLESPEESYTFHVDGTPPRIGATLTSGDLIAASRHPTRQGHWVAPISGSVGDPALEGGAPGSGVDDEAVFVTLTGPDGEILGAGRQLATLAEGGWTVDYVFSAARPTGRYTVSVDAADRLGNASSMEVGTVVHLDAAAPAADLDVRDEVRMAPDQPLKGLVSELPLPKETLLALRFEEEGYGTTTFYDSSGAQRHGSCHGGANCPLAGWTGQSGSGVRFDGTNNAISLSPEEAAGINGLRNDLSVAAWIKPRKPSDRQQVAAADRSYSGDDGFAFGLDDDHLRFQTFGVHDYVLDSRNVEAGVWTHVAAVMDDNNDVTFYIDGVAQGTVRHDQPANADSVDRFLIGSGSPWRSDTTFDGVLDEVVVVGRAIGADEVRQLAQRRTKGVAEVETAFRPALPGSPFHDAPQPASLALHLPLDDASAGSGANTLFKNLADQEATATCAGAACPDLNTPGRVGSGAQFDGREDTIALRGLGTFTTTTVAAWVRPSDATGTRQTVLAYREQQDCGLVLALHKADRRPYAAFNGGGTWARVEDGAAIPAHTWVHLAASYDGTTLRIYRDGELVGETAASGTLAACGGGSAAGSNPSGSGDLLAGALDDVRVYSRALSGSEIDTLYLGRSPLLALPFDFDRGWASDGVSPADASAWDHATTLHTGGPSNRAVTGQEGTHALTFDGRDDYVAVAAAPSLALDNVLPAFTQAAWVRVDSQDGEQAPMELYPIISSAAYDTVENQYPFLQIIEGDRLVVGFGDGTTLHSFTTDPVLTAGTWQHVAGVFDGETYTVYVDGEARAETDQFAALRPTNAQRFDVGRGAYSESLGCATIQEVTLTGMTWEQQWRVRYEDEVVYESSAYPTAGRAYALPLQQTFCDDAWFELEARYWDTTSGWNWTSLGSFDLAPVPGERSHTFSAEGRTGALTWRTTTPQNDLRHFRGELDGVTLYPWALSSLDVQRLCEGRWQPAEVVESGNDVDVTTWRARTPDGLEGSYEIDARGWDSAGHADNTGLSRRLWSGELDTRPPRLAITRTVAGDRYHYEAVAEDYNLVREGFSSPCGAGVGVAESFAAPWYRTLVDSAASDERLRRLTAECDTSATALFQAGVWDAQPWLTGQAAIAPEMAGGTALTTAYVPAGRLWQVDVSDAARPRLADIYPAVEDAQNVVLNERHAYVSEGTRGLSILPLDDPSASAARYDTPGEALDVAVSGDYAAVADGKGGVRVLDVSDLNSPVEVGYYATASDALGVAISGGGTTSRTPVTEPARDEPAAPTPVSESTLEALSGQTESIGSTIPPLPVSRSNGGEAIAAAVEPDRDAEDEEALSARNLRTALSGPAPAPASVSPADWASIHEQIKDPDHALTWQDIDGVFVSHDRANAWTTSVTEEDVSIEPADGAWTWKLALTEYGAGGEMENVTSSLPANEAAGLVSMERGAGLREWYRRDARGVEQGFTLERPPVIGSHAPIRLQMALTTSLKPRATHDGRGVLFRNADGQVVLRYADLHVSDADGRALPALLSVEGERALAMTVDATEASYPITIDPLLTRFSTQLTAFDGGADGQFSYDLAVNGDTLAVGAPWVTGTVTHAGAVYLFKQHENGPDAWGLVKKITATNGLAGDRFGSAVALSDDWLAVGAPYAPVDGNAEQGAVYVFERNEGGANAWGQTRVFSDLQGASGDHFGAVLDFSMTGNRLAIGAPQADSGMVIDAGATYVFALLPGLPDHSWVWQEMSVITATGGVAGDGLGSAVAMDGDTLVAGAPQAYAGRGTAHVYTQRQDGTEAWDHVKALTVTDGVAGDQFGAVVDIRDGTIAVGAPLADIAGQAEQGAAYLFERGLGGLPGWGLRKKVSLAAGAAGDHFGTAVTLEGDVLLAGAPDGSNGQGTAYLFVQNRGGRGAWGLTRVFTATTAQSGAAFGRAVGLGGSAVAIGAPLHDLASPDEGTLFLLSRRGDSWVKETELSAPGAVITGNNSIDMNADLLAVGAPEAVVDGERTGAVYLFQRDPGGADPWGLVKQITAELPSRGDLFGTAVAFSGDTLIVGAPGRNSGMGKVSLFERDQGGRDNWGNVTIDERLLGDAFGDRFGQALAAGASWFLVGGPYRDSMGSDEGIVRLFARVPSEPDGWNHVHNTRGHTDEMLGSAMASSGGIVALVEGSGGVRVGAIHESDYSGLPWHDLYLSIGAQASSTGWGQALALAEDVLFVYDGDKDYLQDAFHIFHRNEGGADQWRRLKAFGMEHEPLERAAAGPDLIALKTNSNQVTLYGRNEGGLDNWGALPPLELAPDFSGTAAMRIVDDTLIIHETDAPTNTVHLYELAARPVGYPDSYTTEEDQILSVAAPGVLTNDEPTEGSTLTVEVDTPPAHGTVTVDATGAFSYAPAPLNYYGPDAFTYRANDGVLDSLPTTVTLTVNPVNDPPVAHADSYMVTEDTTLTISAPGVLSNDDDVENDSLTANLDSDAARGDLVLTSNGAFEYAPSADFDGIDAFSYHANDGEHDSATVTVTLDVQPMNDAPVAHDDGYTTLEDEVLNVGAPGVLANDSDVDGDTLEATVVQSPTVGALTLASNGSLVYEPPLEYSGVASFTYHVSDGILHDRATVAITVTAVNDPPETLDDAYTTDIDTPLAVEAPGLLTNDNDAEGATLEAALTTPPTLGAADVAVDGGLIYTPTAGFVGLETFTYRASDGELSATATVTVTVNGPPSAEDVSIFTDEDTSTTILLVPDHTSDPEGDAVTVTGVSTPVTGTAELSGTTGVRYAPAANFTGQTAFSYTVADPRGLTDSARITVTVGGVNDRPVAVDDEVTTPEDRPVTVAVLANDSDPDGQTPQLLSVTAPTRGSAEIDGNAVVYAPSPDVYGEDGFAYTIGDGVLTATARVTVTVRAVNDAPTLDPLVDLALEPGAGEQVISLSGIGSGATNETQPLDIRAASSNPDLVPTPTVSYDGASTTGELRFTPAAAESGASTVSVTVSDTVSETSRTFQVTVWEISGPFAYVAAGGSGLVVIDLSEAANPRRIGHLATPGAAQDVTLVGDTAYVAAGAAGLLVVDVSHPARPRVIGTAATPGFAGGSSAVGHQVFVADGYAGVAHVDAADPTAPRLVSSSDTPGYASQVTARGRYLYAADGNGGLRVFDTLAPPGQATACDRAGNCTTAAATVVRGVAAAAAAEGPSTEVNILNTPPILKETAPLTVTGKVLAEASSVRALTLTVDGGLLYQEAWAAGAISTAVWHAPWHPTGLSDGPHRLRAELSAWDGTRASHTVSVTVDTRPPDVTVETTVLTSTHYEASGALMVEGTAMDAGGVARVALLSGDEAHEATLGGNTWRAPWYVDPEALPDGETFSVTVEATDVAGRVRTITRTVLADVAAPTAPTLRVHHAGTEVMQGETVREISPSLNLTWSASNDGSGPVDYSVEWLTKVGDVESTITDTSGLEPVATYTPPEAAKIAGRLGAGDAYGQQTWQRFGPLYADTPRTPDYVSLNDPGAVYRGWMESGCALLGVDRRIKRAALDTGTLNTEQRLYGTWDDGGLRVAWTGANWGASATEHGDGDLFIYVDTATGGSTTAFDPYGARETALHMPGVTPASTVDALKADVLVWVRDADTALLLRWQDAAGEWRIEGPLDSTQYRYDAEIHGGQTDLYLPFALIGLTPGGSLDLVAFAAEEGTLDVWATMPSANPINSGQVVETASMADPNAAFALLHRFHWESVASGVCPNGSDGSSAAYPDTEVQAALSATPDGVAYNMLGSHLFWLWEQLTGDKPADVSSHFHMMSTEHPRVGRNQVLTYTLRYRNTGEETATGLYADVNAHDALRLTPGGVQRQIALGDLAPGGEETVTFQGVVDPDRSPEPWAAVSAVLYDDAHPKEGPPLERLWVDHRVDRSAPRFVGIMQPAYVLGAGLNRVRGYVYDESPVPELTLSLQNGSTRTCTDSTPQDGAWACDLDASGYDDGDVIAASVQAVDAFGQASAPSAPQSWVVDTVPPTVTLKTPGSAGDLLVTGVTRMSGELRDNHGLGHAELCLDGSCNPATVRLAGGESMQVHDDRLAAPLVIGGSACAAGTGIARTFTVTESFAIGGMHVAFSAEHPRRDELEVTLIAPSGVEVRLLTDDGLSGTAFRNYNVLLDDAATGSYAARSDDVMSDTMFARVARPASPLAALAGQEAAGDWQLLICDNDAGTNEGIYLASSLYLSPEPQKTMAYTGTWTATFHPAEDLDYVAQELSVVGVDLAGNRSDDPVRKNLVVDNVAPVLTTAGVVTQARVGETFTVVSGTVNDGGPGASVFVDVQMPNGKVLHERAQRQGNHWWFSLEFLMDGKHAVWVKAIDLVGNTTTVGPHQVSVEDEEQDAIVGGVTLVRAWPGPLWSRRVLLVAMLILVMVLSAGLVRHRGSRRPKP